MTPQSIATLNFIALAALVSGSLHAEVKPNPLFTDARPAGPGLGHRARWREGDCRI
jgi:hypothetical protein